MLPQERKDRLQKGISLIAKTGKTKDASSFLDEPNFGLLPPGTCCPSEDLTCHEITGKECRRRLAALEDDDPRQGEIPTLFHQDAVLFPGSKAAEFGRRWANMSLHLWDNAFSSSICKNLLKRFGHELEPGEKKVCQWPHWHSAMAAVYALNLLLNDVNHQDSALVDHDRSSSKKTTRGVELTRRMDVMLESCHDYHEIAHVSMMDAKHTIESLIQVDGPEGGSREEPDGRQLKLRKKIKHACKDPAAWLAKSIMPQGPCEDQKNNVMDWATKVLSPGMSLLCSAWLKTKISDAALIQMLSYS
jgi:hypothetical protein